MNKYILDEHPVVWCTWKSANMTFDSKELHQEKSKKWFFIGYEAIINQFGNGNPYKKDDAQQKFMEDLLLFVAKAYMSISIEES
jgi:hypothetical protein